MDAIRSYWVEWLCGCASAAVLWLGQLLWKRQKESEIRQRAIEKGLQALLRDRIVQAYYHYSERGWITLHGLENVNMMYVEYHNLGGNGTVTKLMEDIRKLEVRND